jgi:hypothetical protein
LRSEIFKFLLGVALMLVVSGLLAFNALLLWVATGPRSLSAITPYIEDALSSSDHSYNVKIGSTRLIWDGWRHPVDIRLGNVAVFNHEGKLFTTFPEIALGVDVLYLPLGRIMPTSLAITAPQINLVQNPDLTFGFGFKQESGEEGKEEPVVPFSTLLQSFLSTNEASSYRRLKKITIHDGVLKVSNSEKGEFFSANDLNLLLSRNRKGEVAINSYANMHYGDFTSNIHAEFSLKPGSPSVEGALEFSGLMPDALAGLFTGSQDMKSLSLPVSGKVKLSLNMDGSVRYADFDIAGGKGNIISDRLIAPLAVGSLQVKGSIMDDLSNIQLDMLNADIEDVGISASGTVKLYAAGSDEEKETPEISADVVFKNIAGDKVKNFWPPALSPLTREWVTENISGGKVPEARLKLAIKKGDLAEPILPKEAIDASIKVEDLKIRYLPEHPPVTRVNGNIHIDGLGLNADIASADFLDNVKLSNGHVLIEDLNADNPYIKVFLHAESPAKDMVHFLGLPRLKHAEHLGLRDDAAGSVKGDAEVGFNFFAPKGKKAEDAIVYKVKAEVAEISQNNFLHKFDLRNVNGSMSVDNNAVEFAGTGEVNGAVIKKGNVKYLFQPEKGINTLLEVDTAADGEIMKRFGYPEFPFMKGSIGINAKVRLGDEIEQTEAVIDLENAAIILTDIGWKKPVKEAAMLELTTEKKSDELKINSFSLKGKNIEAKGSAALVDNFSRFSKIQLSQCNFDDNDISYLKYEKDAAGGMTLEITAGSADLTSMMEGNGDDGFSFKNFPAIQLKADIDKLILGSGRVISDFKGELNCDKDICHNANLSGASAAEKPFAIKIDGDGGQRKISIHAEDAGSFLNALGIFKGMNGGVLSLNGNYSGNTDGSTLKGKIEISEHTIKDAPLLGKILSLASLTGFIDALQGNGIRFKELDLPFTLHNDVLTLEKGKTYGPAIGITVDGTITFPKKVLNLQGTIVPSYTLNSVLGNVPLLGDMLTGGEGQGVFAARYSISGTEKNENINVNPLSILTPGFLRGLFDIFDRPASGPKDEQ